MRYRAEHVVLANGADPVVPPVPGLRELTASGAQTGDRHERSTPAAARARRRRGGAGAFAGGPSPRRRGDAQSRAPSMCSRASRRRWVRRSARHCAATASQPWSSARQRRRGERATTSSWKLADGRALRGDRLLVATGRRPRVEGIGLETAATSDPHGSRSTRGCVPASGCGRSRYHRYLAAHPRRRVPR